MAYIRSHARLLAVGIACTGLGAGVSAIATAGATGHKAAAAKTRHAGLYHAGLRHAGRRFGRAVHGQFVVSTAGGFKTITFDRGFVQSVSGSTLTIREGTASATYRTLRLTIPAGARIRNNRQAAALSSLTPGEHVVVLRRPAGTAVIARSGRTP
jgi:hypothetical protein